MYSLESHIKKVYGRKRRKKEKEKEKEEALNIHKWTILT
jgi:hypothetical protein